MTSYQIASRRRPRRKGAKAHPARPRPLADAVLNLIWQERHISRAEIARRTALSRSTVSEIVDALLTTGMVVDAGPGESLGGRRPIMLHFRDDACCILGVEMSGSHVAVVLTDLRGRVLDWELRDHPVRSDPAGTRALITELCATALRARKGGARRLVGIGVGVPSPVDPRNPFALSEVVLPEWRGTSGIEKLRERFGVPVMVDNDANLGALAEQWWGAGRGISEFAYVKVGTGVGSGHVIHGELYRGATGFAGEIGHLSLDPDGEMCVCGLRGCLVLLVGSQALVRRAKELREAEATGMLVGEITMTTLEAAALAGDPLAMRVTREAAEHLGVAVAGMLNLMNPSVVIVGGGITTLGDRFLDPLRETVRMRTRVSGGVGPSIVMSGLGPRSVAVGAATLVLKEALANPRMFPAPGAH
ncbi:MAG TPA: ROK family transcriptional regulator [Candidatus Eisenbacteria bacterium]|nr:ROK family transcriptional regulator [Candidatus Eisenbacteria bacterium]